MNRICSKLPAFFSAFTAVLLGAIVLLQVIGQRWLTFAYQNRSLLSNAVLWPAALLVIALLFFLRSRESAKAAASLWRTRAVFAAVLAVQLVVARSCWFHLGWDPGNVYASAEELARGEALQAYAGYFNAYANNAPFTVLVTLPIWAAMKIGLAVPYVVLPYLGAVALNLASYVCMRCVQELVPSRTARLWALILSIGWLALSPFNMYPYTDTFSVFFPSAAFYVWLRCKRPCVKWFLISLLCFFGACIKPTVLIVLIALAGIEICQFLSHCRFRLTAASARRAGVVLLAVLLGLLPGKAFEKASVAWLTGSTSPEEQHTISHFLMMGMNDETYGGNSQDDVAYSKSFPTLASRRKAELQRAWERISTRGVVGNLRFFTIKAYKAYADGSFASHSSFLELEVPKRSDPVSVWLRRFYHRRGDLMPYCQTLAQGIWLCVLTLCAVAAFRHRRHPSVALLSLTLLGLTAYLLLFEVWPRYLFLYAPFFIILSSTALEKPDRLSNPFA